MIQTIGVEGRLKITLLDTKGNILMVDEGPNLVVDSGLMDICHLVSGNIQVPLDLVAGSSLSSTLRALPHVPLYGQFGPNSTPPASGNNGIPGVVNGTLDKDISNPLTASPLIKVSSFFPAQNSLTVQFALSPSEGNGPGGAYQVYREAVLMCKTNDSPETYSWFARRVFSDVTKDTSTIITAEWTFLFTPVRT